MNRRRVHGSWTLQLECGHEAHRSDLAEANELPHQVLCHACESLIGSQVKSPLGKLGVVAKYEHGHFDVAWADDGVTQSTLDELREHVEFVA
jgi:hypothetical protein